MPLKNYHDYAVIDTETTGLESFDRIIEIGIITLDGVTLEEKDRWESLANPGGSSGPKEIHLISDAMLKNAPPFRFLAEIIAEQLDSKILVGSNIWFDIAKLRKELTYIGAEFRHGSPLEVCANVELREACESRGIFPSHHWHRAICDAECVAEIFRLAYKNSKGKPCQIILPSVKYLDTQTDGVVREDVAQ